MEFFEEVAKFRAAREIYAKIMKDIFHAKNAKSLHLRFHVQTSGESLTAQQVDNNIVRVTTQALAVDEVDVNHCIQTLATKPLLCQQKNL